MNRLEKLLFTGWGFGIVLYMLSFGIAHAAAIPLSLPATVAANGSSFVTTASSAFSGAAFNSGLTTQVAGRAVTVPATWRMAANAGQFATAAMRLNPAWAIGGAVASWALPYGVEWANGQWQKKSTPSFGTNPNNSVSNTCSNNGEVSNCGIVGTVGGYAYCGGSEYTITTNDGTSKPPSGTGWQAANNCTTKTTGPTVYYQTSPQGYFPVLWKRNSTGPAVTYAPMTNADWADLDRYPLTDAAANQASQNGVAIPLEPVVSPDPVTVPLSEPYTDPVTGKRYRDVGYVTPNPSDPRTADLQTAKQEVDATGAPVTDPATGTPKLPEKSDDECLKFPNRLGCMEMGEVPKEADITKLEKTITITPAGGWGADTAACPADVQTSFLKQPVSWSFKLVCDGADMFRPVVLAMAWISAIMIALGISRRS